MVGDAAGEAGLAHGQGVERDVGPGGQASPAGEKSSVLISPSTLKTTSRWMGGSGARDVNHSAAAQLSRTRRAAGLEAAISITRASPSCT